MNRNGFYSFCPYTYIFTFHNCTSMRHLLNTQFKHILLVLMPVIFLVLLTVPLSGQTITDGRSSVTFNENTLNSSAQLLYPSGTTSYSASTSPYFTLRVQYLDGSGNPVITGLAEDILFINEEGTGTGEVNVVLGNPNIVRVGSISCGYIPFKC